MPLPTKLLFKVDAVDPTFGKPYNTTTKEFQGLFHKENKTKAEVKQ